MELGIGISLSKKPVANIVGGGGGGGLPDIADLSLWFKGGEYNRDGSLRIDGWYNQQESITDEVGVLASGASGSASQSNLPDADVNGITIPDFVGNDAVFGSLVVDAKLNPIILRPALTHIVVCKAQAGFTGSGITVISSSWNSAILSPTYTGFRMETVDDKPTIRQVRTTGGATKLASSTKTIVASEFAIIVMYSEETGAATMRGITYKGEKVLNEDADTDSGGFPGKSYYLGSTVDSATVYPFDIYDVLTYDRVLEDSEVNELGNWLADRWGGSWIDLPTGYENQLLSSTDEILKDSDDNNLTGA